MATLLWIESGSCSGDSMAILGAEGRGKDANNLMDFLELHGIELLWHPSLSPHPPSVLRDIVRHIAAGEVELTLLCVEGSIIHGPNGTGQYDTLDGHPKRDLIATLCHHAQYVFAMGTCAAYGGIPAAPPNPSESTGLQYTHEKPGGLLPADWTSRAGLPVINVGGCPADASTMIRTMNLVMDGLPVQLKKFGKPHTVLPCLCDPNTLHKKCRTGEQVGYSCYGCIGAHFPANKPLYRPAKQVGSV